jgi:NADH-ubiquinone/plastoquinone oxidoreductase, chain 3.
MEVARGKQLNRIADEINLPQRRPFMNVYFFLGIIFIIFDLVFILMALDVITNDGSEFPILIFLICSLFAFILLYVGYLELKKQRSLFDQFSNDPEEY